MIKRLSSILAVLLIFSVMTVKTDSGEAAFADSYWFFSTVESPDAENNLIARDTFAFQEVDISASGRYVIAALPREDYMARTWELLVWDKGGTTDVFSQPSYSREFEFPLLSGSMHFSISPDEEYVAVYSSTGIMILQLPTLELTQQLELDYEVFPEQIIWSADSRTVAFVDYLSNRTPSGSLRDLVVWSPESDNQYAMPITYDRESILKSYLGRLDNQWVYMFYDRDDVSTVHVSICDQFLESCESASDDESFISSPVISDSGTRIVYRVRESDETDTRVIQWHIESSQLQRMVSVLPQDSESGFCPVELSYEGSYALANDCAYHPDIKLWQTQPLEQLRSVTPMDDGEELNLITVEWLLNDQYYVALDREERLYMFDIYQDEALDKITIRQIPDIVPWLINEMFESYELKLSQNGESLLVNLGGYLAVFEINDSLN